MPTRVRDEPRNPFVIHSEAPGPRARYAVNPPPNRPPKDWSKEARQVAGDLISNIKGEVRFDEGSRALYATDLSVYRQVPIGVVVPRDADDVVTTVAACKTYGVPVLGRGCGTSLAGQTCNLAVVIDFSKYMNDIVAVDEDRKLARVQPGAIRDELNKAALRYGLTSRPIQRHTSTAQWAA